eukprot:4921493-Pyramimonas_sp.AAC.1
MNSPAASKAMVHGAQPLAGATSNVVEGRSVDAALGQPAHDRVSRVFPADPTTGSHGARARAATANVLPRAFVSQP